MITDLQIQRMKPLGKQQTIALKDGSGLSLRIEPNGRKIWSHRKAGKMTKLDEHPTVTLADANAATADPTKFGEVWQLWYDEVAAFHKRPENATRLKSIWSTPSLGTCQCSTRGSAIREKTWSQRWIGCVARSVTPRP